MINHGRGKNHTSCRNQQPLRLAGASRRAVMVLDATLYYITKVPVCLVVVIGADGALVGFDQYCTLHRYVHQRLYAAACIRKWRAQNYIRLSGPGFTLRMVVGWVRRCCLKQTLIIGQ